MDGRGWKNGKLKLLTLRRDGGRRRDLLPEREWLPWALSGIEVRGREIDMDCDRDDIG